MVKLILFQLLTYIKEGEAHSSAPLKVTRSWEQQRSKIVELQMRTKLYGSREGKAKEKP